MTRTLFAYAISSAALLAAPAAFADPPGHHDRDRGGAHVGTNANVGVSIGLPSVSIGGRSDRHVHSHRPAHPHGMPPGQAKKIYHRGEYVPHDYRGHYVRDYRRYGLRDYDDGYAWVRVDSDAYLMQVATGLIVEAAINAMN